MKGAWLGLLFTLSLLGCVSLDAPTACSSDPKLCSTSDSGSGSEVDGDAGCTPAGSYRCSGAVRERCEVSGWRAVATCATVELCVASAGETCAAPACAVGEATCVDGKRKVCDPSRTGFTETTCRLGCDGPACTTVQDIVGGGAGFCVLLSTGRIRCWGSNAEGAMGVTGITEARKPVELPGVTNVVQVVGGYAAMGARLKDGSLLWWGMVPTMAPPPTNVAPTAIPGVSSTEDFAIGAAHACARFVGGAVKCWGYGTKGQLGDGTATNSFAPSLMTPSSLPKATGLALGFDTSFVLIKDEVRAFGLNEYGQLGLTATSSVVLPNSTFGLATQVAPSASGNFTCARLSDGTVKCAGINPYGQLGNGTTTNAATPVSVTGLVGAKQVATGQHFACALLDDGTVRCWGQNFFAQLGDGTTTDSSTPVQVPKAALSGGRRIALSSNTGCVVTADDAVKCWGVNTGGKLGADLDPATYPKKVIPTDVVW